jgi:hypothetical protein
VCLFGLVVFFRLALVAIGYGERDSLGETNVVFCRFGLFVGLQMWIAQGGFAV